MDALGYLALFAAGLVAGVINVVAGGGSFLTLPILIFLGLPAGVANGTNRVGIVLQNVAAVWSFDRHGVLERGALRWAAIPATAGAALGTWAALEIPDEAFERVLAFLMVAVSIYTLWRPADDGAPAAAPPRPGWLPAAIFFTIGIYGGFVQAGVGFFLLAGTTFAGLDLVRGNAVKVLTVLAFTLLSLALFALAGKVVWLAGLVLAAGTVAGGLVGARLTVLKGHRWVRGAVTIAILVFATMLLVD
ncbi:MAG: TSUP family transporter [Thermoanaerobaculia bacterium]|nr:TSUP family transporter [Thermoanaerobaculia bacterium]